MTSFRALAVTTGLVTATTAWTPSAAWAQAATQTTPAAQPFTAGWQDGFALQSGNGDYRLVFGLTAQEDGRFSLDTPTPIVDTFTLRKVRPTLSGRVGKYFDFKVMPDFGNGTTVVQDAYFDIRFSPKFRVRTGKDKTPVGYELLIGDANLFFPERALASSLVPNRDIGVQAQGDLVGGILSYSGGVFNGIPDGSSTSTELDTNNTKDLAGRLTLQPFKSAHTLSAASGFGVQLGGSSGKQIGALPSFKTSVGQTYFSYISTATASGARERITPAVFYYYKALGAFGEYVRSSQKITKAGVQSDVTNHAWEVTGAVTLTGEATTDRGVRPDSPFDPAASKWGAIQFVVRYAVLTIDPAAFSAGLTAANASQEARSFTIGANWYPVAYVKYYVTFERTTFNNSAARPAENMILFRTQLAF